MYLFAPFFFELHKLLLLLTESSLEILELSICLIQVIPILLFLILCIFNCVQHTLVETFSFLERNVNVQFKLLVIENKFFRTFACVKISMRETANFGIQIIHVCDCHPAITYNLLEIIILLFDQNLQWLHTL